MKSIEVDFEVWQKLTALLRSERDTHNAVIRRDFLKLGEPSGRQPAVQYLSCRGGSIPIGTKLKAMFKGTQYTAEVAERGIKFDGRYYGTPSEAAQMTTVNGWLFWWALFPGEQEWRILDSIRRR